MITDVATMATDNDEKAHLLQWIDANDIPKLLCHSHTQLLQVTS
jgi:hypothetical protein